MSPVKRKILLLLLTGISLGFAHTLKRQGWILKQLHKEWKKIDQKDLEKKVRELYRSKLIEAKENKDGSSTFILSDKGKVKALTFRFEEMSIGRSIWDGKWRVVLFDIPENKRSGRDALRSKLRSLGFHELQKSVFVFPYECEEEVNFLIEFFDLRKYTRYGILEQIDNELHLKQRFRLQS